MTIVKLSSKNQIVIPAEIRKQLGIKSHARLRLSLSEEKDKVIIEPLTNDPIKELTGILKDHPKSLSKELLRERNKDRIRENSS